MYPYWFREVYEKGARKSLNSVFSSRQLPITNSYNIQTIVTDIFEYFFWQFQFYDCILNLHLS